MIILRNTINFDVPSQKAFQFLADPENFPKWNYYLKSVRKMVDGNPIIGSVYHQVRNTDEQFFTITRLEENRIIELTATKKSKIKFRRLFTFSTTTDGCSIEDHFELAPWVPTFIGKLINKKPQKAVKENLIKLKELLETGQTLLQDKKLVVL